MLQEQKGGELNEKQKGYLNKAMRGAERMVALINDMLNVQRIEQGRMEFRIEKVEVLPILEEVKEELEIKAKEKQLALNLINDNAPQFVYADRQKFREVLINLVGNSVKYTDQGKIDIIISNQDNKYLLFSVKDTGRGIEKDDVNKLFHKFQRLDSTYRTIAESGGTGLGLYIVKLYMSSMGGSVGVESEGKDKGSTFWATFPTDKASVPQQLAATN